MVIGGTDSTRVGRQGQVQDPEIIKEVVVHGDRDAPPMDGTGVVMVSDIVCTSTCGKHGLVGYVRWVLVPKYRIKIIAECVRINRRLIRRISGLVLDKCC